MHRRVGFEKVVEKAFVDVLRKYVCGNVKAEKVLCGGIIVAQGFFGASLAATAGDPASTTPKISSARCPNCDCPWEDRDF